MMMPRRFEPVLSITSEFLDESESVDESSPTFPRPSPDAEDSYGFRLARFSPTIKQPDLALDELRAEYDERRRREAICLLLSVFVVIGVLVCLGIVISPPRARDQAKTIFKAIERSSMVQFSIEPKPHIIYERYGRMREETTDFYGFVSIRGQLFPRTSEDTGQLRFDGFIQVKRNTSTAYDMILMDHRGLRIQGAFEGTNSEERVTRRFLRCLTHRDIPPLHALDAVVESAFEAQSYSTFRVNCSDGRAPLEFLFAHRPFVVCRDSLGTYSPIQPLVRNETMSQALEIHGERLLLRAALVQSPEEAALAKVRQGEDLKEEGRDLASNCPYLEAPMTTPSPTRRGFLYDILPRRKSHREEGLP